MRSPSGQFLFDAVLVMMIVIVSIFIMTALFTWRYRGANRNAPYTPNFAYYWPVEILIWCVPAAIIGWLSHHLWGSTHRLDSVQANRHGRQATQVEAVTQDWKWLFIYAEQNIAVVNELVFPSAKPLAIARYSSK